MVLKELLDLADLSRTWTLVIHELKNVVLVSEDKDLIFAAFQVMASSLKSFNNRQELLIVSLVSSLNRYHFLRK